MLRMAISPGLGRAGLLRWARGVTADWVLVREKHLAAGELVALCREVRAAAQPGTRVLVAGGRVDVALAAGLEGVHLSSVLGELRPEDVRRLWPQAWISVSCHTLEEARRARGASSLLFAPVFGKRVDGVQMVAGAGLPLLAEACRAAGQVPVLALGGVTAENAAECLRAGAAGVAGIRMFAGPEGYFLPTGEE